ncbi:MAG: 5-formyltetrahydrofolate cyclo-ligase [Actinobacteria bacterium]|nr:5-formyltetrahydrofolate cyclo-ligase [Actinomycetota bacterium]
MMDKQSYRATLFAARAALSSQEREVAASRLKGMLAAFLETHDLPNTPYVAAYCSLPEELDATDALELFYGIGATVAFPCTHSHESMDFYVVDTRATAASELPAFITRPNKMFGEEICADFKRIEPCEFDIMLIPGVGFDRQKNRLGFGAGCYDRYLERIRKDCLCVGIAFDEQVVDELPSDPHDMKMDFILTPTQII